jgi:hypothetical protein
MILCYLMIFGLRDKTMISKVWKVFKEVAIGILLVLSLLLVISGALKDAGIIDKPEIFLMLGAFLKNIQYGTLSDWISSLSTFFTLVVAVMAYKAAPKWLQQKYDETAFSIASPLIEEKIPLAKSSLHSLEKFLNELTRSYTSFFLEDPDRTISLISKELKTLISNHRSVTSDLRKLERFNWHLVEHKSETQALSSLSTIEHWLNKIPMINYEYRDKRGTSKITPEPFIPSDYKELVENFESAYGILMRFYNLFEDGNPYNSYFNSTRSKKDNNDFFID